MTLIHKRIITTNVKNSEIKKAVGDIYVKTGMTLTDAIRGLYDFEKKGPEVSKNV